MLRVIVVGAGINGVTAAIELKRRGHKVFLIDPGPLPHPLAASTDISKAIRAAYGADEEYTALAERSIPIWRKWNQELGVELYHETGVLFLRRRPMEPGDFEYESCKVLERRGHKFERINSAQLRKRFPAFNAERFQDGFFDPDAGYVESGRVVAALAERDHAFHAVAADDEIGEGERALYLLFDAADLTSERLDLECALD